MRININVENTLSLAEAARSLPAIDGRRPHTSTLWRWIRRGISGVHLDHARVGRRVVTSREALARFAAELAEADDNRAPAPTTPASPRARSPQQRERDIRAAEAELLSN